MFWAREHKLYCYITPSMGIFLVHASSFLTCFAQWPTISHLLRVLEIASANYLKVVSSVTFGVEQICANGSAI